MAKPRFVITVQRAATCGSRLVYFQIAWPVRASGTPMADVTKTGDTFYTNELLDNVLVSRDGMCQGRETAPLTPQ